MIKIATWNVNSLRVRLPHVSQWLTTQRPDILALQETKLADDQFPAEELQQLGYHSVFSGQKTYNGVALLSREPATDLVVDLPNLDDPQRRVLGATIGPIRILNLYVPNGQAVGTDKYTYKLGWLDALAEFLTGQLEAHPELTVVGDFNIAPEDRDVHDPAEWEEKILCSTPEREAYRRLLQTGLTDTFRLFDQPEASFSWWDYRAAAFRRNRGLRIDLILASVSLSNACKACLVDVEPRRLERPSDHAPVVAEFDL